MPKPNKSSASSGTRKKHARKAAGPPLPLDGPKDKSKKKNKTEPKQKSYIPPSKPVSAQPDPLDVIPGLKQSLPPELLVVLRSLGKKAAVTKNRALEELQSTWISQEDVMLLMLPVWVHHLPMLLVHPDRRIRALAASLHASLLRQSTFHELFLEHLDSETILGTWCLAAHDVDRGVAVIASKSFYSTIKPSQCNILVPFISRTLLQPLVTYNILNPPAPPPPPDLRPSAKKRPFEEPKVTTSRTEQEEDDGDRKTRLRIGALGSLRWLIESKASLESLSSLLSTPLFWTILCPGAECPFLDSGEGEESEVLGHAQPGVRKAAWGIVNALVKAGFSSPIMTIAILRSAWVERDFGVINGAGSEMWAGLLTFLRAHPDTWALEARHQYAQQETPVMDNEEDPASDEEEQDHEPAVASVSIQDVSKPMGESEAYAEFLAYIQLGCAGNPQHGFPAVLVVLSTIPNEILLPPNPLVTSLWAALEGGALSVGVGPSARAAADAWVNCVLECTVHVVKRLLSTDAVDEAEDLAIRQFIGVWEAAVGGLAVKSERGSLKADIKVVAQSLVNSLKSLNAVHSGIAHDIHLALSDKVSDIAIKEPRAICSVLKVFEQSGLDGWYAGDQASTLRHRVLENGLAIFENNTLEEEAAHGMQLLLCLIDTFGGSVFKDEAISQRIDTLIFSSLSSPQALSSSQTLPRVPFLLSYLKHRPSEDDQSICLRLWRNLLKTLADNAENAVPSLEALVRISGDLPEYLRVAVDDAEPGERQGMDQLVRKLTSDAIVNSRSREAGIITFVLKYPDFFISTQALGAIVDDVNIFFLTSLDKVLRVNAQADQEESSSFSVLEGCLGLLATPVGARTSEGKRDLVQRGLVAVSPQLFVAGYLLPRCYDEEVVGSVSASARGIWDASPGVHSGARDEIIRRLKGMILDTTVSPTPEDILTLINETHALSIRTLDILPNLAELDHLLQALSPNPIHVSAAVNHTLIPPTSLLPKHTPSQDSASQQTYDNYGQSSYVRALDALVYDRRIVLENLWMLRHVLSLEIHVQDALYVPSRENGLFSLSAMDETGRLNSMRKLLENLKKASTYALISLQDDGTAVKVVDELLKGSKSSLSGTGMRGFILDLISAGVSDDTLRNSRVLQGVLNRVFEGVGKEDADKWVRYARSLEKSAPHTCMAIASSIAFCLPEASLLDRFRNELASSLFGMPVKKANTLGLTALWKLACIAPPVNSSAAFLPQPRAVNLMKACQAWIAAEDDDDEDGEGVDEEVESAMTLVFISLVPILQNVPGQHWELMFDLIENNLENCPITNDDSLVTLSRTLQLVYTIQDLTLTNKSLKEVWKNREVEVLKLTKGVLYTRLDAEEGESVPKSFCRELALSIAHTLPPSMIEEDALPAMCHLLDDSSSSVAVESMTYQLLRTAARKRTESVVIEAGVDSDGTFKAEIPVELLNLVQRSLNLDDVIDSDPGLAQTQNVFGYLLAWMILFDLFTDASFKVKSDYIEQLRALQVLPENFIPTIFAILGIDRSSLSRAIKLDVWAVDEFHVQLYEPGTSFGIPLLAAHLYYRALTTVPSLVHSWLMDCKDRQLSTNVLNYTSQYFSPLLITTELAQLKGEDTSPTDGGAEDKHLVDETFSIKVYPSVREVSASYLVDEEHQLEIKLKIPVGLPLQKIEVKDVRRVGVDDLRWRAWILAVQQIIWSRNGSIVDALRLFKKNVTSHFSGQVECAICYSTISMMDGQLPRKPCKTCKNRFHSGCLFKWFNSSHSSSCPLCRSDIL